MTLAPPAFSSGASDATGTSNATGTSKATAPVLNALSVDVEDYFQVSNFDQLIDRKDWAGLPSRVSDATDKLLDLFDAKGHRATFFSLGWVADRHPALLARIADRGHEIACHGYGHELVYAIGPERFREDLRRARKSIEDATGVQVTGYRAPSYSVTRESLWALEILSEEGFLYDSSIFPIRHHRYGIPEFSRTPVRVELENGRQITEFPMTTLRVGNTNLPLAGGAYLRFLPNKIFRTAFSRLVAQDHPTVLYVHPWEVDPGQPRQNVSLKVRVNHYYNLGAMAGKLGHLLDDHAFAPLADVLSHLEQANRLPKADLSELVQPPSGTVRAPAASSKPQTPQMPTTSQRTPHAADSGTGAHSA